MTREKYKPDPNKDNEYWRERKYLTRDGKRAAFYVRYIGKEGNGLGGVIDTDAEIKDTKKRIDALTALRGTYTNEADVAKHRKRWLNAFKKMDILEIKKIEDEKGSKLDKLELGFFNSHQAKSYAELERYINVYVEEKYKSGSGLAKIRATVKEYGDVDVSTTTIKKRLIASGVYEKRPFGHERKVSDEEIELQDELQNRISVDESMIQKLERDIEKLTQRAKDAENHNEKLEDDIDKKVAQIEIRDIKAEAIAEANDESIVKLVDERIDLEDEIRRLKKLAGE